MARAISTAGEHVLHSSVYNNTYTVGRFIEAIHVPKPSAPMFLQNRH